MFNKKFTLIGTLFLALCTVATSHARNQPHQESVMSKVYRSQPYYFHYFKIDVPSDINLDEGIDNAGFWGNEFRAYPIASQRAFTELVEKRIAYFKNHKISQKAKDYENKKWATLERLKLEDNKKMNPRLHMTTALYKSAKYDEQRYLIISNPDSNLDATFSSTMYRQVYLYVPEQHKYIRTNQVAFPARFLVEEDRIATGKKFLDENVRALSTQYLSNPKVMAVGPIAWIKPDSHPTIQHTLKSKQVPMRVLIRVDGYQDAGEVHSNQKEMISQIKGSRSGKKLVKGWRKVAGVLGEEVCYYFAESKFGNTAHVRCMWGTDGVEENLDRPYMEITMVYNVDSSEQSRKQAMAAWQQLLDSVVKRGHS